jgi:hypothetical protein
MLARRTNLQILFFIAKIYRIEKKIINSGLHVALLHYTVENMSYVTRGSCQMDDTSLSVCDTLLLHLVPSLETFFTIYQYT